MSESDDCRPKPAPEGWGSGVEAAAGAVSGFVRLGLKAATLPAMIMPRSLRDGLSRAVKIAVQASGIVPHAVARGVDDFADDFAGRDV